MTSKIFSPAENAELSCHWGSCFLEPFLWVVLVFRLVSCGLHGRKKRATITSSVNLETLLFGEVGVVTVMTAERYGKAEKITRYF